MTKVRILGRAAAAEGVLERLQRLGLVEIADARGTRPQSSPAGDPARSRRIGALRELLDQTQALLAGSGRTDGVAAAARAEQPVDVVALRAQIDDLATAVSAADRQRGALRDEQLVLDSYIEPLRRLLPLVPIVAGLDADRLALLRLATVVLVLNTDDASVVEALRVELSEELADRYELVSAQVEEGAMGCLVVYPSDADVGVHALLGRAAVRSVALPTQFVGLSLRATVAAMQRRQLDIPAAIAESERARRHLLTPHLDQLETIRADVSAQIELLAALNRVGTTRRAFLTEGWIPRRRVAELRRGIEAEFGSDVYIEDLDTSPRDRAAPVLMHNTRVARPFEPLVRFLELPRSGSIDPTLLMAIFLPLMFGSMVGDIGYGMALLALALFARVKLAALAARMPEVAALLRVLLMGAGWSIVFGALYGEFFGDLGQRMFGDWALWQYRPSAATLEPLLIFAVVLGAAHVVLGLGVGAWQAARFRQGRELLDKIGTLLALAGLFGLAGWAADRLPSSALTASVAAIIVGLVLVMSLHGLLGLATGPLDLLGRLGNILSYLRLAAVGLASAHLAGVANQLGSLGPIWMGLLIAIFFHALNLALASFSPMIQALRLQYVEFFGAFFVGGGREFEPFGQQHVRKNSATT